jgi:6-phospho-3-hexuloisomerase
MHIGFDSYAVGEIIVPAVGPGDLFVAITASGTTETTVRQALKAQAAGATVGAVVERPSGELVVRADHLLHVSTSALGRPSEQHSTTLFCQVVQIMFDVCCAMLQRHLDQSDAQLNARHSNLE